MIALRYVYVLALVVWLGGMITIGGVVAPAAFGALELLHAEAGRVEAASVVGEVLRRFKPVAWTAGATLLVTLVTMKLVGPRPQGFGLRIGIVSLMLASSLASGLWIDPEIGRLRDDVGQPMSTLTTGDARRVRFGRLHAASTALMGVAALGGLALCYWETRE
jgi:Domain of unknown function (DUF4149)